MNWAALSASADIISAAAIVGSLLYLAIQVRQSNKQRELESFRHTWDSLNQLCESLSSNIETASIVCRGRDSLESLNNDERLIFEYLHIRILNTIESWHHQVKQTSKPGPYRDSQLENVASVAEWFFKYPGTKTVWREAAHTFVPIQGLMEEAIKKQK